MEKRCTRRSETASASASMVSSGDTDRFEIKRGSESGIDSPAGRVRSDKRFINIQMFICAWTGWTEACLADALRPARVAVTEDRYDDNEDKRGAKFLVGVADRARPE